MVEFPAVIQAESRIFGIYTPVELLTMFLVSSAAWIVLKGFGLISIGLAAGIFAALLLLRAVVPEEVGYAFPLYELKFAWRKKTVYSHELDTTKHIPNLDFVDGWVMRMRDSYGAVVEARPVNFFYSTPAERRAILDSYRAMLNSLDFPIQILSISYRFNLGRYLNRLLMRLRDEDIATNPFLRSMVEEYIRWLDAEVSTAIMRRYYIIVTVPKKEEQISIGELKRRAETVISGLRRGGIAARLLEREDILEIYELLANRAVQPKNYSSAKVIINAGLACPPDRTGQAVW